MKVISLAGMAVAALLTIAGPAGANEGPLGTVSSTAEDARVLHLLNRAAFGPSTELIEEVHRIGRGAWVGQQLLPSGISDPDLDAKLSIYPALPMTNSELLANYPNQNGNDEPMGIGPPGRVPVEVASANLTRAVHGKAQLQEVMTDFWFNHFNVAAQDGPIRLAVVSYVRDAIRPNALGYFEDMLRATAESAAMLYYLDNYLSAAPGTRGRNSGINENYARELMELHTLGVDGGYTQEDIIEIARAFTGWTFTAARTGTVGFTFLPRIHDPGPKRVLGTTIPSGNQSEGLQVLHMLATHPSTAEFLSRKILQRLVAENPPQELVDRTAAVFLATGGHIGWTVASVILSDEFYDPAYRANKAKTPLELVASALRATGADVTLGVAATRMVGDLGQPMLRASPPTGWPEVGAEILSPGGMVTRFEFGFLAAANRLEGARVDAALWEPILQIWGTDGLAQYLLGQLPSDGTRKALEDAAAAGADPSLLVAMVLGSPEFQLQ
ncbi:MAG: DUF1800 domain-containing protein [Candidatus Binatia bacterium]|nr:DUF1800 domain-containing protein [Candidatus Binatia bacterium]